MAVRDVSTIEVGQAYFDLHHKVHRVVEQRMCAAGLSLTRSKVLMRLSENGPMNQATLAGMLGFAPRSVTDAIDALERDGLVTRTEDERDRRARIIALTPAGVEAHDVATAVRQNTMDEIFGSLSPTERARLSALFSTIRSNLPSGENSCE